MTAGYRLGPPSFDWTEEATAQAVKLWKEGRSASEIANLMGIGSRNAVIGKLHRLGITREKKPTITRVKAITPPKAKGEPKPKVQNYNLAAFNLARRAEIDAGRPAYVAPAPVVVDASNAKPWTERQFGECAYPISGEGAETFSCCAPTKGKIYCAAHHAVMFYKPQPITAEDLNRQRRAYFPRRQGKAA